MAINKNHEFDELNGIKCAIVEKNVLAERVEFLKQLLEFNRFTVVVVPSPAAKTAAASVPKEGEATHTEAAPAPVTFTIGVTNLAFNSTNAIFGRMLKTKEGHIVTLAYWQQKDSISRDEVPYFEK
ncbi:MAG: hypothetical protein JST10_11720 [Bacteroidetes bacterium]|nr:hypothetical protein [Bacteroidota bacterium]MBS1633227.1 hypothetical protein [Bacteroidota bacterium]